MQDSSATSVVIDQANRFGNGNGIYIPHFLYAYIQMRFPLVIILVKQKRVAKALYNCQCT